MMATDTPQLRAAQTVHGNYIDLLEDWSGKKENDIEGGDQALYLYSVASQVLDMSQRHGWGDEGDLSELPSRSDLDNVLGSAFTSIDAKVNAFDKRRLALIGKLSELLSSEEIETELLQKPYHERIWLTANLLDRLDLYAGGQQLVATLLQNDTVFTVDRCLNVTRDPDQAMNEYLDVGGTWQFDLSKVGASEAADKALGGIINYLKAVSTTILKNYTEEGNLNDFIKGIGHVVKLFHGPTGQQLIDNPSAASLTQAKNAFDETTLEAIRSDLGTNIGNVLLVADQLAAIIRLVLLFVDRSGSHDVKSLLTAASEAFQIVTGVIELAYEVSARVMKDGLKHLLRGLSGLANLASAVVGLLDARDAFNQGDYSVMWGYFLTVAGALGLAALDVAILSGVVSGSVAGPVGIVIGLVVLIGSLIVIYTADSLIETWFETSVFGEKWGAEEDWYSDPSKLQFLWQSPQGAINYNRQAADLFSMLRGLSLAPQHGVGPDDHLGTFDVIDARSQLDIPEDESHNYDFSALKLFTPGLEPDTWVFLSRVTKGGLGLGGVWDVEPIYCVDVHNEAVHSLDSSTSNAKTKARHYAPDPSPDTPEGAMILGIWLAATDFETVYGLSEAEINDGAYLEFDVVTLPRGSTLDDATKLSKDLENQPVARKRTKLTVAS